MSRPYSPEKIRKKLQATILDSQQKVTSYAWCDKCGESRNGQRPGARCFKCQKPLTRRSQNLPIDHGEFRFVIMALQSSPLKDEGRKRALMFLFPDKWATLDMVSSKDLTDHEKRALFRWIDPKYDKSLPDTKERLLLSPEVSAEIQLILHWVMSAKELEKEQEHLVQSTFIKEMERSQGVGRHLMYCGHPNNTFNDMGQPVCTVCPTDDWQRTKVRCPNPDFKESIA